MVKKLMKSKARENLVANYLRITSMHNHKVIYLEPVCPECDTHVAVLDRLWCQDDVWASDKCEGCGGILKATKYELSTG